MKAKEIFHEKDVSTQQKASAKNSWISCENEDSLRESYYQSPSSPWTQETRRLKFTFPKRLRLLKRKEFREIAQKKSCLKGKYIIVDYIFKMGELSKIGIAVSTKFGKAHIRNRFKRIIREAFRTSKMKIPQNIFFIVRPRPEAKGIKMAEVQKELLFILARIDKNRP